MQRLFSTWILASVVVLTGSGGNVQAVTDTLKVAQGSKDLKNQSIALVLPIVADVVLKTGNSVTGKVTEFNPQHQEIQVARDGASRSLLTTQIQQIAFRPDALAYKSDGKLVIRGQDNSKDVQSTWENIPLTAFKLVNPQLGQARVDSTALPPKQRRGIEAVAKDSLYVVDEMEFQPNGKMEVKVTATDR